MSSSRPLMRFEVPDKPQLPRNIKDEDELREAVNRARLEEINKRLLRAGDGTQMAKRLRQKKKELMYVQPWEGTAMMGKLVTSRIYIPAHEFPDKNFVGLIIGPGGGTLRQLERITRTRIYVRGSYKDKYAEPLHCYITAENKEDLRSAATVIENLIEEAVFSSGESRPRVQQPQETTRGRMHTDWEKFYYWWYYYNGMSV
jgi:protein quaking